MTTRIPEGESAIVTFPGSAATPSYSQIDDIEERGGHAVLSGWMFHADGPFDAVAVRNEVAEVWDATSHPRHDLPEAFPTMPHSVSGGFEATVPLEAFRDGDRFVFTLIGIRGDATVARRRVEYQRVAEDDRPLPPEALMLRAAGTDRTRPFLVKGALHAADLTRPLSLVCQTDEVKRFFEWGCGCGWLTRHLARQLDARPSGIDLDGESIEWMASSFGEGDFSVAPPGPPVSHEDGTFAVAFALSLFEHLDAPSQLGWLAEMHRILRPSGVLVVGTFGTHAARLAPDDAILAGLAERGIHVGTAPTGEPAHRFDGSTFVAPDAVEQLWGTSSFHITASLEAAFDGVKDLHVLQKR